MKKPYLSIGVSGDNHIVITHHKDGREDLMSVPISLEEMNAFGFESASQKIGEVSLRLLRLWHPQTFSKFPNLTDA